jgi:hypothetical protein
MDPDVRVWMKRLRDEAEEMSPATDMQDECSTPQKRCRLASPEKDSTITSSASSSGAAPTYLLFTMSLDSSDDEDIQDDEAIRVRWDLADPKVELESQPLVPNPESKDEVEATSADRHVANDEVKAVESDSKDKVEAVENEKGTSCTNSAASSGDDGVHHHGQHSGLAADDRAPAFETAVPAGPAVAKNQAQAFETAVLAGPTGAEEPAADDRAKAFEIAATEGRFDLRKGAVAKAWLKYLADPQAAQEYKEVGKCYEKQRLFRKRWAEGKVVEFRYKKTQAETKANEEMEAGTYESQRRIEILENDVEAAAIYAVNCTKLFNKGIKFMGQPCVKQNCMTDRTEFLYLKAAYRTRIGTSWAETADYDDGSVSGPATEPETPVPVQKPSKIPIAEDTTKKGNVLPDGSDGSPKDKDNKEKKDKTMADVELQKLRVLKNRWNTSVADARGLRHVIDGNADWAEFRPCDDLTKLCNELEGIRNHSPFYQQWCMDPAKLRRLFTEPEIMIEARRRGEIENLIERCEEHCAVLKAMKSSKDAVLKARATVVRQTPKAKPAKKSKAASSADV